ncbi:MAG: hypothetical protein STSR0009_08990 [Methanoregula sp.]
MKKFLLVIPVLCIALVGYASTADATNTTATPAANTTAAATTAPARIGGNMGAYLINANVDGANVTVDKDFKGAIPGGKR